MNRKTFLITIVAVVAIGIAAGVWVLGTGQTGSLSGRMTGTILTASLDRTTCHNVWMDNREGTLRGTLTGEMGLPLAGKTIEIYDQASYPGWSLSYRVTTLEDGSFSCQVGWVNGYGWDFRARFPGDAANLPSEVYIWDVYC